MEYHYTTCNSSLQKSVDQEGFFRGYASIFNLKDSHNDIVLPGAFRESIKRNDGVKLLWQHDQKQPIGTITLLEEDKTGLIIEGQLLMALAKAKEAHAMIKSGIIQGMSIGYTIDEHFIEGSIRYLSKLSLVEISLVTFPANTHAKVNYIKSYDDCSALARALSRANKALQGMVGGIGIEPTTSTMST